MASRAHKFLNTVNGLAPKHRVLVYTHPSFAETGACAGPEPLAPVDRALRREQAHRAQAVVELVLLADR